jgi:hypothetical protein
MSTLLNVYSLFIPKQAVGANKVYFDLFNDNGSGKTILVKSISPVVSGAVAITGAVAVDLFLTRTTSIGTGGTGAGNEGSNISAPSFSRINQVRTSVPDQITARLSPSGGAAAGAVISWVSVFTEETNAATYLSGQMNLVKTLEISISEGFGIRIVQGAVASVGNIGFNIIFELE